MASSVYMSCSSAYRGRRRWRESFIETSGVIFGLFIDRSCFTPVTFELPILSEDKECIIFKAEAVICNRFAKITCIHT